MTKQEIEEHFAMRKFEPLQKLYMTYSNGQRFNEACYSCLAHAQQVMFNNVKEIQEPIIEKPTNDGNKRNTNKKRK